MSGAVEAIRIDRDLVWTLFERFVSFDTSVAAGETSVDPSDPRIARFAEDVARPAFAELGADVQLDGLNNVVATFGRLEGTEIAFVSYPVLHHANLMLEPLKAHVRKAPEQGNVWHGAGASQGKAGMAAVCAAARALIDAGVDLSRRVILAMCTEGSSGHSSSEQLYKRLVPRPAAAVLTVGTQNKITLGNRGRVDVRIRIAGKASHSSAPELGVNPIAYLPDIIDRITHFELDITPHPLLGRRAITIYSLTCGPTAPHTTPIECRLTIDRRLLPGDSLEHAVDEIRTILRGLPVEVEVTMGPHMLPVLIAPETAVIERLVASARQVTTELDLTYPSWTFDAGYPASIGIPAIMFGPSTSDTSGAEVMTDDYVTEAAVLEAANVYAAMMFSERNTA